MKQRSGFVSNSSTSSFICEICGDVEAGMGLSITEIAMTECEHYHVWHDECLVAVLPELAADIEAAIEKDESGDLRYEIPKELCPVCQYKLASLKDIGLFAVATPGVLGHMTMPEILEKMKEAWGTDSKARVSRMVEFKGTYKEKIKSEA